MLLSWGGGFLYRLRVDLDLKCYLGWSGVRRARSVLTNRRTPDRIAAEVGDAQVRFIARVRRAEDLVRAERLETEDVAAAVAFLVSPAARQIRDRCHGGWRLEYPSWSSSVPDSSERYEGADMCRSLLCAPLGLTFIARPAEEAPVLPPRANGSAGAYGALYWAR